MDQKLLKQLNRWHEENNFQQIIDTIEALKNTIMIRYATWQEPTTTRGEDGDFEQAIQLLQMVSDMGSEDPLWHYRLGYAYFYSGSYEKRRRL